MPSSSLRGDGRCAVSGQIGYDNAQSTQLGLKSIGLAGSGIHPIRPAQRPVVFAQATSDRSPRRNLEG